MDSTMYGRKRAAPRLVDLCVNVAIDNVRFLGDVGETDFHLLDRILPYCTEDELVHIEKSTAGRDLSQVTDKLWRNFYERQFGEASTKVVIERMSKKKVKFPWRELYEAKLKDVAEAEKKTGARIRQLYKKEDDRKQSRKIILCTKVPPSSNKRSFYGGSGYNLGNGKSNLVKKAKIDVLKSREMKNLAAMKKIAAQRNNKSASTVIKPGGFPGKNCASSSSSTSSSKPANSLVRRF